MKNLAGTNVKLPQILEHKRGIPKNMFELVSISISSMWLLNLRDARSADTNSIHSGLDTS